MDKRGDVSWKFIIGGIIAVIILIIILVLINKGFAPAQSPFTKQINKLRAMDFSDLTAQQRLISLKQDPTQFGANTEKWRISDDLNKAERELREMIKAHEEIFSEITSMGKKEKWDHVRVYDALSDVLFKRKQYREAAEKNYESYNLIVEKYKLDLSSASFKEIKESLIQKLLEYVKQGGKVGDIISGKDYEEFSKKINKLIK